LVARIPPITAVDRNEPRLNKDCFGILPSSLNRNPFIFFFNTGSISWPLLSQIRRTSLNILPEIYLATHFSDIN
jgi:hypothetical protein